MNSPDPRELWEFLPVGYALTVALETPILWWGLSPGHSRRRKLLAAFWLTACTYPIVVLVLPLVVEASWGRWAYIAVAETFAPAAEVALFLSLFREPPQINPRRDALAIIAANLNSFLAGGWLVSIVSGWLS